VTLWDVARKLCLAVLQASTRPVNSIALHEDSSGLRFLATGSEDGSVRCWQILPEDTSTSTTTTLRVVLCAGSAHQNDLYASGCNVAAATNLDPSTGALLKQLGARTTL